MKRRSVGSSWFCLAIFLLGAAACQTGTDSYSRKVAGGVEVKDEVRGAMPQPEPRTIYIADFALDTESYRGDEGLRGTLPGRFGQRLPHPLAKDNPAERARQVV
jgi:hypothetical protein